MVSLLLSAVHFDLANMEQNLKDLWTASSEYQRCYQTDDDVESTLRLLELDHARALVDVGCGNGAFAVAAAGRFPGCRIFAFDALESAVAECRARAEKLPARNLAADVAWAHALPVAGASADRALCRSVLHHIAEPQRVYNEVARVLQPGGRFVLQTPCNYWEPEFADALSDIVKMTDDTHPRYFYRRDEIVSGLRDAGFQVSEPECWTYTFPFLNDDQAALVRQYHAEERLHLRAIEPGKWCMDNYWARVVAIRNGG